MLDKNPDSRLTLLSIRNHSWLHNTNLLLPPLLNRNSNLEGLVTFITEDELNGAVTKLSGSVMKTVLKAVSLLKSKKNSKLDSLDSFHDLNL